MSALKKKLRAWLQEVMHERVSPHAIATGAGIGTVISVFPTPGFNILLCMFIIFVYPKVNKVALFAPQVLWNPLTVTPFYWLSYKIGNLLFSSEPVVKYNIVILDQLYNFSRRFLVGNAIIAIALGILTYVMVRLLVRAYRKRKQ